MATGVLQTPMGMLVDKLGAKRVLVSGLFITSAAFALSGFTTSYWELLALFFIAGAGNSVFHPADYVILTASVEEARQGRAYSMHSFGGSLGTAAGPAVMVMLMTQTDWRTALIIAGSVGVLLSLIFVFSGNTLREDVFAKQKTKAGTPLRSMFNRGVILLFLFYVLTSSANIGLTAFAPIYLPASTMLQSKPQHISYQSSYLATRLGPFSEAGWPTKLHATILCSSVHSLSTPRS